MTVVEGPANGADTSIDGGGACLLKVSNAPDLDEKLEDLCARLLPPTR